MIDDAVSNEKGGGQSDQSPPAAAKPPTDDGRYIAFEVIELKDDLRQQRADFKRLEERLDKQEAEAKENYVTKSDLEKSMLRVELWLLGGAVTFLISMLTIALWLAFAS